MEGAFRVTVEVECGPEMTESEALAIAEEEEEREERETEELKKYMKDIYTIISSKRIDKETKLRTCRKVGYNGRRIFTTSQAKKLVTDCIAGKISEIDFFRMMSIKFGVNLL